ncbi:MAG: hypothetical protein AAFX99_34115, partial [Myxococcota bacterium]
DQTRRVVQQATQVVERVVPALQSLSGRQLMELSLSLGQGNSLRQAARSLGLANGVLSAFDDLEAVPALADSLTPNQAGPEGFGATLKALPSMVMQAATASAPALGSADPTIAAIDARLAQMGERPMADQSPSRFSELTVLDPALGALSERLATTGVVSGAAEPLRAPLSAYVSQSRTARARHQRAQRMLPAIDRALATVGGQSTTASGRSGRRGGPALRPQALGGSMLRQLKSVGGVLQALGTETPATDTRSPRRPSAMLGMAAGLPKELIAPFTLRQVAQQANARARQAQQAALASVPSGSDLVATPSQPGTVGEVAEAMARGGDDVAIGRAGMAGLWLPSSVERALGQDAEDLISSTSGALAGTYVLPQVFSGRHMRQQRGSGDRGRSSASEPMQIRGSALRRTAHSMALGLQSLAVPDGSFATPDQGVTVGVGSATLSWSPWMTTTPAQDSTRRLMTLLGMGDLVTEAPQRELSGAEAAAMSVGVPPMNMVMPQPIEAELPPSDRPSVFGGLNRTLLQRATARTSPAVAQGRYQGADMAKKRELYSPHQAAAENDESKSNTTPHIVARAATSGSSSTTSSSDSGGAAPAGGGGGGQAKNVNIEETAR